jgi:hypothetical protein
VPARAVDTAGGCEGAVALRDRRARSPHRSEPVFELAVICFDRIVGISDQRDAMPTGVAHTAIAELSIEAGLISLEIDGEEYVLDGQRCRRPREFRCCRGRERWRRGQRPGPQPHRVVGVDCCPTAIRRTASQKRSKLTSRPSTAVVSSRSRLRVTLQGPRSAMWCPVRCGLLHVLPANGVAAWGLSLIRRDGPRRLG